MTMTAREAIGAPGDDGVGARLVPVEQDQGPALGERVSASDRLARPRRRRSLPIVVAVVLAAVGLAWWLGSRVASPASRAAKAGPPVPSLVTAVVERRVLAESVVTRGDVRPSGASIVSWSGGGPAGGAGGVVTALPVHAGDEVVEGRVVVEVSGRPVLVIGGDVPVYRDLRPGSSGRDVEQLQAALVRLGFTGVETDGTFGPGTKTAVVAWYQQAGYQAPLTSADATAQLATAASAVSSAKQRAAEAEVALTAASTPRPRSVSLQAQATVNGAARAVDQAELQARSGNDAAAATLADSRAKLAAAQTAGTPGEITAAQAAFGAAQAAVATAAQAGEAAIDGANEALAVAKAAYTEVTAPADTTKEQRAVTDAQAAVDDMQHAYNVLDALNGAIVPATEFVAVPRLPARVDTVTAVVGARADGQLVALSVDAFVVESLLSPGVKPLVRAGAAVKIDDELTGLTYTGTVTTVGDVLTQPTSPGGTPGGGGGPSGYLARIETSTPIDPKLLASNVRVTITGQSSGGEVLVVPVAAVFARPDGTNQVTRVVAGQQQAVTVETGLAAGGFVAIRTATPTLNSGEHVIVGAGATSGATASGTGP